MEVVSVSIAQWHWKVQCRWITNWIDIPYIRKVHLPDAFDNMKKKFVSSICWLLWLKCKMFRVIWVASYKVITLRSWIKCIINVSRRILFVVQNRLIDRGVCELYTQMNKTWFYNMIQYWYKLHERNGFISLNSYSLQIIK